jgi:4a-hydroxytetrahydrobiopterin dehydratase
MKSLAELRESHCRRLEGHAALTGAEVTTQLAVLPQWKSSERAIARTYRFADHHDTIAHVNALAFMVHREDHHPDLDVGYNRCDALVSMHSVGGISENDFICAAKADAIFAQRCSGAGT